MIHRFEEFELDDECVELRRDGAPIELQSKVFAVLAHLVARAGRVATKEELLETVWTDAVVSEASLTRCISLARKALGDTEGDGRLIVTVRGRGYRLGVPVSAVETPGAGAAAAPPDPSTAAPPDPSTAAPASTRRPARRPMRLVAAASVAALLALGLLARPYADLGASFRSRPPAALLDSRIAVVPFLTDEAQAAHSHLAGTLALEIAIQLDKLPDLQVTRPAAAEGRGVEAQRDPQATGAALGCARLLSGRLQVAGERVRVALELIDARSGFVEWSDVYQASLGEVAGLQDRIAQEVVRAVSRAAPIGVASMVEPASVTRARYAYEGRLAVLAGTRESLMNAVEIYERAVELDPEDARSHVALAFAYDGLWTLDPRGPGWLDRGDASAARALELAPDSVDAHVANAFIRRARRDWAAAEASFRRAFAHGGSADAHEGLANLFNILGRPADALAPARRAVELAPLRPSPHRTLGRVWFFLGDDERAISHFQRSLDLRPESALIMGTMATAFERNGQPDHAAESITQALPPWMRPFSRIHKRLAGPDASLRATLALDRLAAGARCGRDPLEASMVWARIGDRPRLYECLDEASRDFLWFLASEPIFDPYRDDPAFRRIVQDAGFPVGEGADQRRRQAGRQASQM